MGMFGETLGLSTYINLNIYKYMRIAGGARRLL